MAKSKKQGADGPTAQGYSQLIGNVDMLLESFRVLKAAVKQQWHWWSMTSAAGAEHWRIKDGVLSRQTERVEWGLEEDAALFGGTPSGPNRDGYTYYFASAGAIEKAEFYSVMNAAESAVKALVIRFLPGGGTEFLTYLDDFPKWRDIYTASALHRWNHHVYWFEFLWAAAETVNCHILHAEFAVDFHDIPDVRLRCIRQDICEASILALRFLRQKAVERLSETATAGPAGETAEGAEARTNTADDDLHAIVLKDFDRTVFDEIEGTSTCVGIEYLVGRLPGLREAEHPDPKTVRSAVNRLCQFGLVKDEGGRNGIAITPKGKTFASTAENDA